MAVTSAEAMAEIHAVMHEEESPVEVVVLAADGTSSEVVVDHRHIRQVVGGLPTFVGSIRKLDVSAVARQDGVGKRNKHALPKHWDEGIKGAIVLFRTVEEGPMFVPKAFRLAEYEAWLAAGGAEEEIEEEEEDAGVEGGEGESDEGEEDEGEEEEGDDEEDEEHDGMDLSQVQAKLEACSAADLKNMLKEMELPVKGKKAELVARILETMQREAEDEDDEDDSEEDEDDEAVKEDGEDFEAGAACNSAGKRTRPLNAETPAAKRSTKGKPPASAGKK